MAPLTSPPDCVRCSRLTVRIAELEDRISNLYKIQEAEQFLDTFILGSVHTDPTADSVPPPVTEPAAPAIGPALEATSSPPVTEPAAPAVGPAVIVDSLPAEEPNNSWIRLGARPKLILASSTPSHQAPWIRIGDAKPQRPTRLSLPQFTPAPKRAPVSCSVHPSPSLPPSRKHISQSKLLLELSQSLEDKKSKSLLYSIFCSPSSFSLYCAWFQTPGSAACPNSSFFSNGAYHRGLAGKECPFFQCNHPLYSWCHNCPYPRPTSQHHSFPSTTTKIIVHVGTCDVTQRQSEFTKANFIGLFALLISSRKSIFISGPIPTLAHGDERFSRLRYLHAWMESTCSTHKINFIHNFNSFWSHSSVFARDGLHLNRSGSRLLAANIQQAVASHHLSPGV
ncbi:hypothetical protein D4764_12G0010930 [Xyrichtys novacula]|uniref:SGNH hydrolase-type esterase domain-containing protein n=1 Tax=Xyrichtys novacula TaxID=13765 RepID=A0AAV1GXR9_XYRNO|nr:hypothetical protein D4764_12G0010930 [Xyrichtys novacula]